MKQINKIKITGITALLICASIFSVAPLKNVNIQADVTQSFATKRPPYIDIEKLSMPVFMYHYIRDYKDWNDGIGVYLSVNPEKFKKELDLIQSLNYETITFEDIGKQIIPNKPIILTFDDGYKDFYTAAYPELKKRHMKAVVYIITGRINTDGYMTLEQLKDLSRNGIEIGSHTLSHPLSSAANLGNMTRESIRKEVSDSKKILELLIGKPVISFCYPGGKYGPVAREEVEKTGYKYATTTMKGLAKFSLPFDLERDRVNSDTDISEYIN